MVCEAGSYCPGGSSDESECPAGFFCPSEGLSGPVDCPAGSYCGAGVSVPEACLAGSYCLAGSSGPTECPAGSYCAGRDGVCGGELLPGGVVKDVGLPGGVLLPECDNGNALRTRVDLSTGERE